MVPYNNLITFTVSTKAFFTFNIIYSSNAQLSNKARFMCDKIRYRDQHKQYFIDTYSAESLFFYSSRFLFDMF